MIARCEWAFYRFDAAMVVMAVFTLNVFNPAAYIPAEVSWKGRAGSQEESLEEQLGATSQPTTPDSKSLLTTLE